MKAKKIISYIIVSLLVVFSVTLYTKKPFIEGELITISVTAAGDIKTTSGRYTKYGYSFLTVEQQAKFTIDNCVNFVCDRNAVKEIKSGDKLELSVNKYYVEDLSDVNAVIPVYSLSVNNVELFSPGSYLSGKTKQHCRILILFSVLALSMVLFNLVNIKPAISWTIIIIYTVIVFILIENKIV